MQFGPIFTIQQQDVQPRLKSSAGPASRKRARQALPLRSEPGAASAHAMMIPELVSLVLECLTERDVGWDPENIINASLVNSVWLESARPIILKEIVITPGLGTSTGPDTRIPRLLQLVGQKSYNRYVRSMHVQFSRNKERARKAAPGRGPDPNDISSLLSLTPWVQYLKITNIVPTDFTSVLQDPLRAMTTLRLANLVFSPLSTRGEIDQADQVAADMFQALCSLLSCWPQLRTLTMVRLVDSTPQSTVTSPSHFSMLVHLRTLTLNQCRLGTKTLTQLFESTPALVHLVLYRPDFQGASVDEILKALAMVQQRLSMLHISGLPDELPAKLLAHGLPAVQDLSIEAFHLDRTTVVSHLPPKTQTLRLVSLDQKSITQAFVARVKRQLHKSNDLQVLKLPMFAASAKQHRKELWQVCQNAGVILEMGPEQVTVS